MSSGPSLRLPMRCGTCRALDGWARSRTRAAVEHHSLPPTSDPVATLFRLRAALSGGMGQLITEWTRDFQGLLLLSRKRGIEVASRGLYRQPTESSSSTVARSTTSRQMGIREPCGYPHD